MRVVNKYLSIILSASLFLGLISSCENSGATQQQKVLTDNLNTSKQELVISDQEIQMPFFINYHLDSLENAAEVDSFRKRYTSPEQEFIFALNRMDAHRLNAGDVLVIPDTLTTNFLDYSPFPERFEMLDSIPKSVLISRRIQGFALYEHGKLIRWGPVSSGKKSTPTPVGLFYGNYKALRKISTVDDSWIMPYYFNFMNFEGVGVHQYALPGYPASHACVRLRQEDAQLIYNWADQWQLDASGQVVRKNGTPFMVYGDYDFEARAPWLNLADQPNSNFLTAEEMETLKKYTLQYRQDKRNRDDLALPENILGILPREGLETLQ